MPKGILSLDLSSIITTKNLQVCSQSVLPHKPQLDLLQTCKIFLPVKN